MATDNQYQQLISKTNAIEVLKIIIAVGTYQHFITPLEFNPTASLFSDPLRHWNEAANSLTTDPVSCMSSIVYQLWLSIVQRLTAGDSLAFGLYSGFLSAITPWIWYRFFRELLPNKLIAMIGWAFLACLPSWIGIYSYVMEETLALPLLGLALWLTWRSIRLQTIKSFIWSTVSWIMVILTKASLVTAAIVCIARMFIGFHDKRCRLFLLIILMCSIFTPIIYRNYKLSGSLNPLGHSPFNTIYMVSGAQKIKINFATSDGGKYYYWFESPSMLIEPLSPLSHWKTSRSGELIMHVDLMHANEEWGTILRHYWPHTNTLMKMYCEQLVFLMFGESWPDRNPTHLWEQLQIYTRWLWAPLFCVAIIGNAVYVLRNQQLPLIVAINLFAWVSILLIPGGIMEGRYRKPFEGLLIANILWLSPYMYRMLKTRATQSVNVGDNSQTT